MVNWRRLLLTAGARASYCTVSATARRPGSYSGIRATTLISNWKPYSQVTPTAVTLG